MRPIKGFFITGTDTGIGKTVITAGLLGVLRRRGIDAMALKPVQTGSAYKNGGILSEDARFYKAAANISYDDNELVAYYLEHPLAPAVAAELEGETIELDRILAHIERMAKKHEFILIEGAGGLLVPLIGSQVTIMDLAILLGLPLLIVARAELGTINHTALTVSCARAGGLEVAGIVINGYNHQNPSPAEETNPRVIESMTGVPVTGLVPKVAEVSVEAGEPGKLLDVIERYINIDALLGVQYAT
ncbi:MAG TPA: dethiobiotin synthase [Anaerolineae bacterium]|nr:dethiobiotin synthase [Anaerolineae bacterium]